MKYVNENETADGQTDGTPVLTSRPVKCKKKKKIILLNTLLLTVLIKILYTLLVVLHSSLKSRMDRALHLQHQDSRTIYHFSSI